MVKAVFTSRVEPSYDDRLGEHYHFPQTYYRQVEAAVGDWVVFYEPRRRSGTPGDIGGRQAYFATARVGHIDRDVDRPGHHYAFVSDFLPFDRPVPFREASHFYETQLRKPDGTSNKGAFGRAVRYLPDSDFENIVAAGFAAVLDELRAERHAPDKIGRELAEDQTPYERPIIEQLTRRPFRDAAFRWAVRGAYDNTCAITGLSVRNGRGRPEVDAAHIVPVGGGAGGSDSIRNGIALSKTVHWMFDRGLLAVGDEFEILVAKTRVPDRLTHLFNTDGRILRPREQRLWPAPRNLAHHRSESPYQLRPLTSAS